MANQTEIDAVEEAERIQGARGASTLPTRRATKPGGKLFLIALVIVIMFAGGALTFKALKKREEALEPKVRQDEVRQQLKPLQVSAPVPIDPPKPEVKAPPAPELTVAQRAMIEGTVGTKEEELSPEELLKLRRHSAALQGEGAVTEQGRVGAYEEQVTALEEEYAARSARGQDQGGGALGEQLKPFRLAGHSASILKNPDYMITQGTMTGCALGVRIVTTVPGMVVCYLISDVYSTNGRVKLLERASKVTGYQRGGLAQGQARIGIVWLRVETPEGVIINIDSPGTGPLGAAGVAGWVDTHFWERFGSAIMLSLVDDFSEALAQRQSQSDSEINFENTTEGTQDIATEILKKTIDIPPTLYKNQGERVAILFARDLEFRRVYDLKHRP